MSAFRPIGLIAALLLLGAADAPPAVVVAPVAVRNVAPSQTFVGQVQAIQSVNVVARVQAFIEKVDFTEGSEVKAGALLFELQKGPYEAAVKQAQGALAQAEAALRIAQSNLERDTKAGSLAISRQQIDQDQAARDQAAGQVETARGNLELAAINLSYCSVAAPIDGRVGRANITRGNLVGPTSGPLATIVQLDPIRVYFAVTDAELIKLERQAGKTQEQLAAALELHLLLPDGKPYGRVGKIAFLNNEVDPTTGTITVWGRFANPDHLLIPGAYVSVQVQEQKPQERPLVPVQAVQTDEKGKFVLIAGNGNKVTEQRVTVGRQIGQDYIVQSGLSGGEHVITEGIQKVHPGQVVAPTTAGSDQDQTASSAGTSGP